MRRTGLQALLLALASWGGTAQAQDTLTIGRTAEQVSMDPQFARTGNNQMTAAHIFERLIGVDDDMRAVPALAVSWRNLDPLTWEIVLREGVVWHDGTPLTPEDVAFSLRRPPTIENSPASFAASIANMAEVEITGPRTLKLTSKTPDPLFVHELGRVFIVSKARAEGAGNDAFNRGPAAIGTGPYRYLGWTPGASVKLEANPGWWGGAVAWPKVEIRFLTRAASRVAALRAGDVQVIDQVPSVATSELAADPNVTLSEKESLRLVYLGIDSDRAQSPFVTDREGAPLGSNPLKDARVREAINRMIDRTRLVERVLGGGGAAANQIVPHGVFGHEPGLRPIAFDPARAKALLVEAGYPQGFGITLHSSNDRVPGDAQVAQALGQFLARGGLQVNAVQTLPYAVYARSATNREYSLFLFSYGSTTGEASAGLDAVLHSYDATRGLGANNRARYANLEFDRTLQAALGEFDEARREAGLREATQIAMADWAMVPLYWQTVTWATRKGFVYRGRRDEHTLALNVERAR